MRQRIVQLGLWLCVQLCVLPAPAWALLCPPQNAGRTVAIPGKVGETGWLLASDPDDQKNVLEKWCVEKNGKHNGPEVGWLWRPKNNGTPLWVAACTFDDGYNQPSIRGDDKNRNGTYDEILETRWLNIEKAPNGTNDHAYEFNPGNGKLTIKKTKGAWNRGVYASTVVDTDTIDAPEKFEEIKFKGQRLTLAPGDGIIVDRVRVVAARPAPGRWQYTLRTEDAGGTGTTDDPFVGVMTRILPGDTFTIAATGVRGPQVAASAASPELGGWVVDEVDEAFVTFKATTSAELLPGTDVATFSFESDDAAGFVRWILHGSDGANGSGSVVAGPVSAPMRCRFDVDEDGVVDIDLGDADGDGFCEFPIGTTVVHGVLRVTGATPIELGGDTVIEAERIEVMSDGVVTWNATTLRSVTLVARSGDIVSRGVLDLNVADDVMLRSGAGSIDLGGSLSVLARDRVSLIAPLGSIVIAPTVVPYDLAILAGNRFEVATEGRGGGVTIERARIAARAIVVDTRTHSSPAGVKELKIADGAELTTDVAESGLRKSAGNVSLSATGRVIVTGSMIDSGRHLRIRTARPDDDLCLSEAVRLEAQDASGQVRLIDFRGVRGRARDDGTTTFVGSLSGVVTLGGCGTAPEPTATATPSGPEATRTATPPGPSPTATVVPGGGLTTLRWEFYVRIARANGSEANVAVPKHSGDVPVTAEINTDHVSVFAIGDQMTRAEIETLGSDTLARLLDAARTYVQSHPEDYADFAGIVELRWAKRVD